MRNLFVLVLVLILQSSCSMFPSKPIASYQHRARNQKVEKIIVLPVTNFQGAQSQFFLKLDSSFYDKLSETYGKDNLILDNTFILELIERRGVRVYINFIKTLKDTSKISALQNNTDVKLFINEITAKLGRHHFAVAVVDGDVDRYITSEKVHSYIGLFDCEKLDWRWVTRITDKKGLLGSWEESSHQMVNSSFDLIKELEATKKDDVRTTASE